MEAPQDQAPKKKQRRLDSSEHQILFTVENVLLIEKKLKFETRRLIPDQPPDDFPFVNLSTFFDGIATWSKDKPGDFPMWETHVRCRYGVPGDTLWVRETWQLVRIFTEGIGWAHETWDGEIPERLPDGYKVWHRSAMLDTDIDARIRWRPSLFMPRWACKLLLRVEEIRAERLHDITEEGARAEGMDSVESYMKLWDKINLKRAPAKSNPWVWVIKFSEVAK